MSTTGSLASTIGYENPFRYRGYVNDNETGLYYCQSRYYDPVTLRYLNADDSSICRRLLVITAEDIGLAYPQGIVVTKTCVDAALQLGFPEARIPLSEAVILLATAPKSHSATTPAIEAAVADIQAGKSGDIPIHLKDAHYEGAKKLGRGIKYQYPHSFEGHWVVQQYLPNSIKDAKYYEYGNNKSEQAAILFGFTAY